MKRPELGTPGRGVRPGASLTRVKERGRQGLGKVADATESLGAQVRHPSPVSSRSPAFGAQPCSAMGSEQPRGGGS